jgi:hypothetical protein
MSTDDIYVDEEDFVLSEADLDDLVESFEEDDTE